MSKKKTNAETKRLNNLPQDVLNAKDIPADVDEDNKVAAQGIHNYLDKSKKTYVDRHWAFLDKLTGTRALQYRTEISYEVNFHGLTNS